MVEVEVKLPINSIEKIQLDLNRLGFIKTGLFCEEDCYFDNEARQIRTNGEALRIRKITDFQSESSDTVITFKEDGSDFHESKRTGNSDSGCRDRYSDF